MRYVKKLYLVFENCETSPVLAVGDMHDDDVKELHMSDIDRSIRTMTVNSVAEFLKVRDVKIMLNPKANRKCSMFSEETGDLFDRILGNSDITSIYLVWEDGYTERFGMEWSDDDYENEYQKATLLEDGSLEIIIKKTE